MSVTICWKPVSRQERTVDGTSATLETINRIAGRTGMEPVRLNGSHICALQAFEFATKETTWSELLAAIEQYHEIEVWGEW